MPKWILHIPIPGEDSEETEGFDRDEEHLLDAMIDNYIMWSALDPRVEWL